MTEPDRESRGIPAQGLRWTGRAQRIATLVFPILALCAALFSIYRLELRLDAAGRAEADVIRSLPQWSAPEQAVFERARQERESARAILLPLIVACGVLGSLGALLVYLLSARRVTAPGELVEAARLRARERELRESEKRYSDLFDSAPVPYEELSREGVVRRLNQAACALLKCPPERAAGSLAWNFVAPDRKESVREALLERIASGREIAPFECDYLSADGARITVEIRENLIRNEQGEVTGVCRSLLDVTGRNLAEVAARKVTQYAMELRNKNEQLAGALDAARSATEAKSRFLASVSHELRTPLNSIIGFSELLYDGKLGTLAEGHREYLEDILNSARHLLDLINDVLDLSKVEAGKMDFSPEPCFLDLLVCEVRDAVRPLAEKKNIRLSTDVPAEFRAEIDPGRFKQVLYNYLSNAIKFTGPDGSIALRVRVEGDAWFKLEVEDTGIGLSSDEIRQLFQEFQQLPNSRKAGQGTGLGLALTRRIVEAQGGTVGVSSTPGRGSVFSAILPIYPIMVTNVS